MAKACSTTGCQRPRSPRKHTCPVCARAYAKGYEAGKRKGEVDRGLVAQAEKRTAELEEEIRRVRAANRILRETGAAPARAAS